MTLPWIRMTINTARRLHYQPLDDNFYFQAGIVKYWISCNTLPRVTYDTTPYHNYFHYRYYHHNPILQLQIPLTQGLLKSWRRNL